MKRDHQSRAGMRALQLAMLCVAALLCSCSDGGSGGVPVASGHGVSASGKAMGGQHAIKGAHVVLYAVGTGGAGSGAAISGAATDTLADGSWNINFTCPAADTPIYAVATGGDSGSGSANSAIALSAVLGVCGDSATPLPTDATINEVTTVAAVYALAQFLDGNGLNPGAGSSANAQQGLANAFLTASNLADVHSGTAVSDLSTAGNNATGTAPAATVNTLADLLAACVDAASQCDGLFAAAQPSGASKPVTTLQALLDIARNPANNVSGLFGMLDPSSLDFPDPVLSAAPNDWTIGISYTGPDLEAVQDVAIDASGNVWATSNSSRTSGLNNQLGAVVQLSPLGAELQALTTGGIQSPSGVAIDGTNRVWVVNPTSDSSVNNGSGSLIGFDGNSGLPLNGSPYFLSDLSLQGPNAIGVDGAGNVWTAGTNSNPTTVMKLDSSLTSSEYILKQDYQIASIAPDASNNIWMANSGGSLIQLPVANPAQEVDYANPAGAAPVNVAIDAAGAVWTTGVGGGVVKLVEGSGGYAPTAGSPYVPSLSGTTYCTMAIDGAGKVWFGETNNVGVAVLDNVGNLVSSTGNSVYTGSGQITRVPNGVAIDASGNVWLAGGGNFRVHTVLELVGAAAPVHTPLIGPPQQP